MKPARIVSLVLGCLLLLPGLGMLLGGGALGLGYAFARDGDGYFEKSLDRLQTPTAAIRSEKIDFLADPGSPDWLVDAIDADLRVRVDAVDETSLFVGVGRDVDVEAYLADVAHDELIDIEGNASPRYERIAGSRMLTPPTDETFWRATAVGTAPVLDWSATAGNWVVVLANADGSRGVAADVEVGAKSGAFLPVTFFLLGAGVLLVGGAVALIVVGTRRQPEPEGVRRTVPSAVAGIGESVATQEHPVSLNARLDPDLSRWMWLVKWILAIPHFVVLALLWVAFVVTTFAAGVAILFTGRYPQGIYEFNLGVLRWTWRVSYYCTTGGIGTDRYPPFSLQREPDYPAVLDIAYPERLSRGLVLVKWWLLAIPHYLILAVLLGAGIGWTLDSGNLSFEPLGGGLLGLLVVVTGAILLFTGRYPRSLFDLIVGFNRWIFRVIAYAALMTDRYPPFRLDQGGAEPGSPLPPPPSSDGAGSSMTWGDRAQAN
jgi:hypothetical protein